VKPQAAALGVVIALGVLLRFVGLETHVFWHDEVYTRFFASGYQAADWRPALFTGAVLDVSEVLAFQSHNPDKGVVDTMLGLARDEPQHPPLYYALVRLWVGAFGDSVATLRALSAVLSLLGLPAMYWFCRELFRGEQSTRVAWTATALLSVSPFFVLYAQQAREYALWSVLVLFANASLLYAMRRTQAEERIPIAAWAGFSLLTAVSLYTSFSTAAVIMGQIAYVIWSARGVPNRTSLSAAAAMAVSAVLFAPWASMLWLHFEAFQASMAWSKIIVIPRTELLSTFALNISRPFLDFWLDFNSPGAVVGVALAVALIAWGLSELRHAQSRAIVFLSLLIAIPIGLLLLPDLIWGGIRSISTRYLTPSLLALVIAVAWAIARQREGRIGEWVGAATLLGCAASCVSNALEPAVWTTGISRTLPVVAQTINDSERPLVVGNLEVHHPGNLLALCHQLKPGTKLQFLDHGIGYATPYEVPEGFTDVFLYSPIPPFLGEPFPVPSDKLYEDLHLSLYRVADSP